MQIISLTICCNCDYIINLIFKLHLVSNLDPILITIKWKMLSTHLSHSAWFAHKRYLIFSRPKRERDEEEREKKEVTFLFQIDTGITWGRIKCYKSNPCFLKQSVFYDIISTLSLDGNDYEA